MHEQHGDVGAMRLIGNPRRVELHALDDPARVDGVHEQFRERADVGVGGGQREGGDVDHAEVARRAVESWARRKAPGLAPVVRRNTRESEVAES